MSLIARCLARGCARGSAAIAVNQAALVLPTSAAELDSLSVDRLTFGNVRGTLAKFIRNGETVVTVRAVH